MKVGDRYRHVSGSIWKIKEIQPNSVLMGYGGWDLVAVRYTELWAYSGEQPYAVMNWRFIQTD
jgi:hypothetical protein